MRNRYVEIKKIRKGIEKHGKSAYKATLKNGVIATILKGNRLCQVSPDGTIVVIRKVPKSKFKVSKSVFNLK